MSNLFWYIDIGNSSISIVSGNGQKFSRIYEFKDYEIPKLVKFIVKSGYYFKNIVIFCSVVPKLTKLISNRIKHYKSFELMELGREIPLSVKSQYNSYRRLGNDRKVNVYEALKLWKAPFLIF